MFILIISYKDGIKISQEFRLSRYCTECRKYTGSRELFTSKSNLCKKCQVIRIKDQIAIEGE